MKNVLLLVTVSVAVSCAQLQPAALAVTPRVKSSYVLITGQEISDQPVLQTDLNVIAKSGLYTNLWHSTGSTPGASEIDLTVGWTGTLVPEPFTAELNLSYYDLDRILHGPRGDLAVPLGELRYPFTLGDHSIAPLVRGIGYLPLGGDAGEPDGLLGGGVQHSWEVTTWITINQRADIGYDTGGVFNADDGVLGDYSIVCSWPINDWATIELPGFRWCVPLTHFNDGRETRFVFWTGVAIRFDVPKSSP